jgi:hypothetical protein
MGTGYTRNDTGNNIADGNVINASDLDGEFDAVEAAFNSSTGHTHDGTSAEGAPVELVGPAQDLVVTATEVRPKTDNTLDLGTGSFEFKDLYIDGTANIDSLVADTADINGGTIDGVTIGGASAGAGTFTTIAGTQFSSDATDVELKYSGSTKLATTNTGIDVTGKITSSGNLEITSSVPKIILTDSDNPSGQMEMRGAGTEFVFDFDPANAENNSQIDFKTDGSRRLLVKSTGIEVTGTVTADGLIVGDGHTIGNGTGDNLEIVSSASENILIKSTGGILTLETAGSERARIDSSGNVGIGTTSPGANLDIVGTSGTEQFRIGNTTGGTDFGITVTENTSVIINSAEGATGRGIQFQSGGADTVVIGSTGNVGIGTTSPATIVHLAETDASDEPTLLIQSENSSIYLRTAGSSGSFPTGGGGNDGELLYVGGDFRVGVGSASKNLIFMNGSSYTERARIDSSGQVGIGTASPSSRLHISGTGALQSRLENTGNTGSDSSRYIIKVGGTSAGDPYIDFLVNGGSEYSLGIDNSDSDKFKLSASGALGTGDLVTVTSTGNVGIGTTSPQGKLTVAGGPTSPSFGSRLAFNLYNTASSGNQSTTLAFGSAGSAVAACFITTDNAANGTQTNLLSIGGDSQNLGTGGISLLTANVERMRINTAGSVGIGTIPNAGMTALTALQLGYGGGFQSHASSTNSIFVLSNAYYDGAWKYKNAGAATEYKGISGEHVWETAASGSANGALTWSERMRLDASGNLGLGVTPSAWSSGKVLEIGNTGNSIWGNSTANFYLTENAYYNSGWKYASSNGAATYQMLTNSHIWSIAPSGTAGNAITFTQAMTIDASGHLLVGHTNEALWDTNDGFTAHASGRIQVSKSGVVGYFNRRSTDGSIFEFRKDGTAIGVIGVANGDNLYIASDDTTDVGLKFDGDANAIYACTATGAIRDNAVTLGDPTVRFKDLYLSGNVYLGGTTSANALDDYEEGTWTPVYVPGTGAFGSVTYAAADRVGRYTKIGNLVYVCAFMRTDAVTVGTASGNLKIGGLPFAATLNAQSRPDDTVTFASCHAWPGNVPSEGYIVSGTEIELYYRAAINSGDTAAIQVSDLDTGTNDNQVVFSVTYQV